MVAERQLSPGVLWFGAFTLLLSAGIDYLNDDRLSKGEVPPIYPTVASRWRGSSLNTGFGRRYSCRVTTAMSND
jgi:hypothetical protein